MLCDSSDSSDSESEYSSFIRKEVGIEVDSLSSDSDSDIYDGPVNELVRIQHFSKLVVAEMDDKQFQDSFRVTTYTFNKILGK